MNLLNAFYGRSQTREPPLYDFFFVILPLEADPALTNDTPIAPNPATTIPQSPFGCSPSTLQPGRSQPIDQRTADTTELVCRR